MAWSRDLHEIPSIVEPIGDIRLDAFGTTNLRRLDADQRMFFAVPPPTQPARSSRQGRLSRFLECRSTPRWHARPSLRRGRRRRLTTRHGVCIHSDGLTVDLQVLHPLGSCRGIGYALLGVGEAA